MYLKYNGKKLSVKKLLKEDDLNRILTDIFLNGSPNDFQYNLSTTINYYIKPELAVIMSRNRDTSIQITNKPHLITTIDMKKGLVVSDGNQTIIRSQHIPKDLVLEPNLYVAQVILTGEKVERIDWDSFAQNVALGYVQCIYTKIVAEKNDNDMFYVNIGEFTKIDKYIEQDDELLRIQKEMLFHNVKGERRY